MTLIAAAVPLMGMARKRADKEKTDKPPRHPISFRFEEDFIDRMERYSESHPLNPTLTRIIELAVTEWLDKHEPELPRKSK